MAYLPFDPTKPDGTTQAGAAFGASAIVNNLALRDAVLMGQMDGFVFSVSGGTGAQPASMFWKNGTTWFQAAFTWGSGTGTDGNPTQIVWSVSYNSGGLYNTIDTQTFTWDSSGNLTATTGAGGWVSWLTGLLGKVKTLTATVTSHTGSLAALGTMSTQNASAVAITGGTASLTTEREAVTALGSISASTAINWALGGLWTATIGGASGTFTHSNLPNGVVGYATLLITNAGVATTLLSGVKWAGGTVPSFTAAGKDLITLMCSDGATVYGSMIKDIR